MKRQHWLYAGLISLSAVLVACPPPPKPGDFTLSSSNAVSTLALTKTSNITVNIERINGFADSVSVGLLIPPTGISADALSISTNTGTLVVRAADTATLGAATLTIEASSGNLKKTTSVNVNIIQSEPPKVVVDTTLTPAVATIPSLDGGAPRALASLGGSSGQSDFVLNEMLIETNDRPKLDALLARWGGTILHETNFNTIGTIFKTGSETAPHFYLVKVNPANANVDGLPEDLKALSSLAGGNFRVSSAAAQKFLAAVASEAADQGMKVSANLILSPQSIATGSTNEASSTAAGYNPNAFTWDYMGSGAGFPMNTGVAQAWQRLQSAGRFANRVGILVADGGFSPSTTGLDLPPVQVFGATETPNGVLCASGNPCLWHGSDVLSALAGIPDNGRGAAGPAGPIASLAFAQSPLLNVQPGFDVGGVIRAIGSSLEYVASLADALSQRPRILNFSGTFKVDGGWGFLVEPMNGIFSYLKNSLGILTFASAGNDGTRDVDAVKCFVEVFDCLGGAARGEEDVFVPCEVANVICVGGLAPNSTTKDPNSTFGSAQRFAGETTDDATSDDRSVDIYGPFSVWVGPNPENASPRRVTGTSFSSPFVAGVAALIWAADPSLTAAQVQTILLETAHRTNDLAGTRGGLRVNALGAIDRVLGNAPTQTLSRVGFSGDASLNRTFQVGTIFSDPDGNCCTTTWSPAPDSQAPVAGGSRATYRFTALGNQTITATTRDAVGNQVVSSIIIGIVNNPPIANMTLPTTAITVFRGQPVQLRGFATDRNQGTGTTDGLLACSSLRFTSSLAADNSSFPLTPTGPSDNCQVTHTFNTNGSRAVSLVATDAQGETNVAPPGRQITVVDPPVNLPPTINLGTLPPTNYDEGYDYTGSIAITASATDPENNTPIQYRWTATTLRPDSSVVFAGPTVIANWSTTSNLNWNPSVTSPSLFGNTTTFGNSCYNGQVVRLLLEARDSLGNTSSINVPEFKVFVCKII